MGQPSPPLWECRAECPTCANKVMYLPLGQCCLFHGFVWRQRLSAWWRGVSLEPDVELGKALRAKLLAIKALDR